MYLELQRTFGAYNAPQPEDDEVDRDQDFGSDRIRLTWSDLHEKRVVVVLGEAGIGKTTEFQLEARRLAAAGRPAFFVPLNSLRTTEDWELALGAAWQDFTAWTTSNEEGFFFLDAVDEARLQSHSDFTRALSIVRVALTPHLARVRFAISSRVTDWTVPEVPASVISQLVPVDVAAGRPITELPRKTARGTARPARAQGAEEFLVTTLDPLSRDEAKRCARHFSIQDEVSFWTEVDEGGYDFMASRPLDLRWMVELWNERKNLGTYTELIEANISARLREVNPHYKQKALSEVRLREGASELAAAAEFGGCAFISVQPSRPAGAHVLDAHSVLDGWTSPDVSLLLATAIFDEASFDRVKFHHRSTREYLAARWVDAKLRQGIPLARLAPLFGVRQYGDITLIPARRPILSWLAAINVRVRAWVVSMFPGLLLHGGDPQSWDQTSADLAFSAVIAGIKANPESGWFKSSGNYVRVGRALGPGQIASVLIDAGAPKRARLLAFELARYGRVADCAGPAFTISRDATRDEWERTAALFVLEVTGTTRYSDRLLAGVEAGTLASNELVAGALRCIEWTRLTPERLAAIFDRTESERAHGPMFQAVTHGMLAGTDLASATLLLAAVLKSAPRPARGERFVRFPPEHQPERAWLLNVLPHCLERVLHLCIESGSHAPGLCLEAAARIEAVRAPGFDSRAASRLRAAIQAFPSLRWDTALAIAQTGHVRPAINRMLESTGCIVRIDGADLPELTRRACDPTVSAVAREIWFQAGTEVAFTTRAGKERASALRSLCGPGKGPRSAFVLNAYKKLLARARADRVSALQGRAEYAELQVEFSDYKADLLAKAEGIADGSDVDSLERLLTASMFSGSWGDDRGIDREATVSHLGSELAAIYIEGLKSYWKKIDAQNPADHGESSRVPWEVLIATSGLYVSAHDGVDYQRLSAHEVTVAARIATWKILGPPSWLEPLHAARPAEVEAALNSWVLDDARASQPGNPDRGALVMALRCPSSIRRGLLAGVTPLILSGEVTNENALKGLIPALYEDGLISQAELGPVCASMLARHKCPSGQIHDLSWLKVWATASPRAAWEWFKQHASTLPGEIEQQVREFAAALCRLDWIQQPWTPATVSLMLEVSELLDRHGPSIGADELASDVFYNRPTRRMANAIARGFVAVRGGLGRDALQKLIAAESDDKRRSLLGDLLAEHAELDSAAQAHWTIERLHKVHAAFDSEPRSEAQLYEQALARLEEIRTSLEEGPFSERLLFFPGIDEKRLQLWLAAKFQDTQNRRFSVQREEEVDNNKRTDIQLACAAGKVCVEIKPLDIERGHSASSLVEDTLKRQLVGQYLKGRNSSRGILVLMQLDGKRWNIPNTSGRQFDDLVKYLQDAADQIKLDSAGVNELHVFGMRCTT